MDWKFKKNVETIYTGDGFWYDITYGGRIKPEDILDDDEQVKKIKEAVDILKDFEDTLTESGILEEL